MGTSIHVTTKAGPAHPPLTHVGINSHVYASAWHHVRITRPPHCKILAHACATEGMIPASFIEGEPCLWQHTPRLMR